MNILLFDAFTDKSPEAIEEFKNRIYKNKNGSSDSSSLVTTNMPFYVDIFLGKELESRDILIKNILNKTLISKLSKKLSWKGKKGNEKILQIEKIGSFYSIKHEIIDEKINIKSVEELFKYNDWLLSGGTWPSKMTNLAISIDKKCENIGEIKGSGENALCIIVRLFAFCLAIDKQFRSNEGKLLKYFRNIDVLYVEWIRESTNSILNYFNLKKIEKVIETLIEEYNEFFEIIEKNPYINPIAGRLNKENQKKIKNEEKEIEIFKKNNKYSNAKLKNEAKEKEEKTKTEKSNEVNIFNENGEINWGNEDFLMNLDY
uniref:Uncharacterized protein n=1 Tax=Meloidogyne enterolobii TaxID=390850 RepID=A0A6V7V888_MELEN|nr:unnamed protein product [Meloidogyne enterolobii]